MRNFKYLLLINCLVFCYLDYAISQTVNKFDFQRIEDNSFLIEEAYNQEHAVIQHISAFQYMKDHAWLYTFTEEWPVPGQKHQVSTTIPVLGDGETGIGDIAINYRYQALLSDRFAFSPRLSLILPTGSYKKGLGNGVPGYQLNLPFSYLLTPKLATHYNFGLTIIPNAKNIVGLKYGQTTYNYGISLILLLTGNFNFMLEVAGSATSVKMVGLTSTNSNTMFINPGIRYAINFKSGLQIVPGLALPIGTGSSDSRSGLFAYLSFEHPLRRK